MTNPSVFLIFTERWSYSDNSGRDCYEFKYEPEDYGDPGYFVTREAAQDWIDQKTKQAEISYQTAVVKHEHDKARAEAEYEVDVEAHQKVSAYASENGIKSFMPAPRKKNLHAPDRRSFGEIYEIREIECEHD